MDRFRGSSIAEDRAEEAAELAAIPLDIIEAARLRCVNRIHTALKDLRDIALREHDQVTCGDPLPDSEVAKTLGAMSDHVTDMIAETIAAIERA